MNTLLIGKVASYLFNIAPKSIKLAIGHLNFFGWETLLQEHGYEIQEIKSKTLHYFAI